MSDGEKYQPWKDYAEFDSSVLNIPILEPPCKNCKYFNPRVVLDQNGKFDGVRLCHTPDDQWKDFSCFRERD